MVIDPDDLWFTADDMSRPIDCSSFSCQHLTIEWLIKWLICWEQRTEEAQLCRRKFPSVANEYIYIGRKRPTHCTLYLQLLELTGCTRRQPPISSICSENSTRNLRRRPLKDVAESTDFCWSAGQQSHEPEGVWQARYWSLPPTDTDSTGLMNFSSRPEQFSFDWSVRRFQNFTRVEFLFNTST